MSRKKNLFAFTVLVATVDEMTEEEALDAVTNACGRSGDFANVEVEVAEVEEE